LWRNNITVASDPFCQSGTLGRGEFGTYFVGYS
jgi:hypothetical protein